MAHLGVVHEARAKALDLLVGGDGAERDLGKALRLEGAVGDAADHGPPLSHDRTAAVAPVQHQACDILLGHVGQLLAEDVLQRYQPAAPQHWRELVRMYCAALGRV